MTPMKPASPRGLFLSAALSITTLCSWGCAPAADRNLAGADIGQAASVSDTAVVAAVVQAVRASRAHDSPIRVDPRPLSNDPGVIEVNRLTVQDGPVEIVAGRTRLLRRLGAVQANAEEDFRCSGRYGTPAVPLPGAAPVPDSIRRRNDPCLALGRFLSVILGVPRPGGPYFPPRSIDERGEGRLQGHWTVRMIQSDGGGFEVFDVVLSRQGGAWQVVEKRSLYGIRP